MSDQTIQEKIDNIKEYLETDLCKQCIKMYDLLKQLEQTIRDNNASTS